MLGHGRIGHLGPPGGSEKGGGVLAREGFLIRKSGKYSKSRVQNRKKSGASRRKIRVGGTLFLAWIAKENGIPNSSALDHQGKLNSRFSALDHKGKTEIPSFSALDHKRKIEFPSVSALDHKGKMEIPNSPALDHKGKTGISDF